MTCNFCIAVTANISTRLALHFENIGDVVPNFFTYSYDGREGRQNYMIKDGGSDMCDTGNSVSRL